MNYMNIKIFYLFFMLIFFYYQIASCTTHKYFILNEENNHLYHVVDDNKSWHDAKNYCHQLGGYLTTITSQSENNFLLMNISNNQSYWLGATDEIENGKWSWINGESFDYSNWKNENIIYDEYKNFLVFKNDEKWYNSNINTSLPFICEFDSLEKNNLLNPSFNSKDIRDYANYTITITWYEIGDYLFGFRSWSSLYNKCPLFDVSESTKNQLIQEVIECEVEEWYVGYASSNFTIGYDNEAEVWKPTFMYSGHPRDRSVILGCKRKKSNNVINENELLSIINSVINSLHTEINNIQQNSNSLQEINNEQSLIIIKKQEQIILLEKRLENVETEKESCDISITKLTSTNSENLNKINELYLKLDEKQNQNEVLENNISTLKNQLSEKNLINFEYFQRINILNNEINHLNELLTSSTRYTLFLEPGWHLVSSIDIPAKPKTEPVGSIDIIYSFDSGTYKPVTFLSPGKGYWVKISKQCNFTLEP